MNEGVNEMMCYKMCCKLEAADEARVNLKLTATNILFYVYFVRLHLYSDVCSLFSAR